MRKRYYKHMGKQVGRAVRDAIRSGNFEDIGRVIDDGVQEFTNIGKDVFDELKNAGQRQPYMNTQNRPQGDVFRNDAGDRKSSPPVTPSVYENPTSNLGLCSRIPGSISGLVYTIIGAAVGIPMVIADILVFFAGVFRYVSLLDLTIALAVLLPITVAILGLMVYGLTLRRRARRFARYRDALGNAAFCTVAKLADIAGETQERAKKDLKKMITCGAFPQGHLDHNETCFMVDDKTYDEYLQAEKEYTIRTEAARAEEQKKQADPKDAELEAVKQEGSEYLQQIRSVNDALPGEVISQKLDRLEDITARIFACVRKHPEKLPDIRRFMRYYMPTTLKLVNSYEEFESQPVQGENITKAKGEIEQALDTINMAFENLLDTLFANDAFDISADISTLETMLKQEGLTGSDFAKAPDDSKLS